MINHISLSLTDLLGEPYVEAVCRARAALTGDSPEALMAIAGEQVEFFPEWMARRQDELMGLVGTQVAPAAGFANDGAPSDSFRAATRTAASPVNAFGCYRVGEDGRLYLAAKSEHYHIPLGHSFPGYRLIENAGRLGIPNATHNNTRGYITRLMERELVRAANGLGREDGAGLEMVLGKREPGVLNRVINLETGSLAVEAALKMMLGRFYGIDREGAPYSGKTPVFLVMGDYAGGTGANYHGTTVLEQTLRGYWKEWYGKSEQAGLYKVVPVAINDEADFAAKLAQYNEGNYKTAGFCHEIVLMNYGGIRLREQYLREAYRLCRLYDTPVLCDEIQSCAWYPELFLFRQYGLSPDFVSVGKGFPGGLFPASKILFSGAYDNLIQFGALVTNGQEELASLAYLITLRFLEANGAHIAECGKAYMAQMAELAVRFPGILAGVEGDGHMAALRFHDPARAEDFCRRMNAACVDVSVQSYKANCPPVALTKLPVIVSRTIIGALADKMARCLETIGKERV